MSKLFGKIPTPEEKQSAKQPQIGCLAILGGIALLWFLGLLLPESNRKSEVSSPSETELADPPRADAERSVDRMPEEKAEEPPTVTKANYEKIKRGMFQLEVDILLGYDGELQSDATVGSTRIQTYLWRSKRGGYILVTFHNDYFYSKTYQAPLDIDLR